MGKRGDRRRSRRRQERKRGAKASAPRPAPQTSWLLLAAAVFALLFGLSAVVSIVLELVARRMEVGQGSGKSFSCDEPRTVCELHNWGMALTASFLSLAFSCWLSDWIARRVRGLRAERGQRSE